jgi:hypothetical protein
VCPRRPRSPSKPARVGRSILYLESLGPPSSDPNARCDTGDGAEICGLDAWLRANGTLGFISFVPDSGADIVYALTPGEFRLNLLDANDPSPGLVRLGELVVEADPTSCGGPCDVEIVASLVVAADLEVLASETATPTGTILVVPEPSIGCMLAFGGLALAGLGARRRGRRSAATRLRRWAVVVATASLVVVALGPATTSAETLVVFSHEGSTDPVTEGWGITPGDTGPGVTVGGVVGSGVGDDLSYWRVADGSTVSGTRYRYEQAPTAGDIAVGLDLGWRLRARVRVPNASDVLDASIIVEYADDQKRWILTFGSDVAGDALVGVAGTAGPFVAPGAVFHLYELAYDPATDTVDLYIDGVLRAAALPGTPNGVVAPRVNFGSGDSSGTGEGHYNLVEWETSEDSDADGIGDLVDGCPYFFDDGSDTGGVGAGSASDGRPDACQCGALDGDGTVDGADIALLRQHLAAPDAGLLGSAALARCAVNGDGSRCDIGTVVRLARATSGATPPLGDVCWAATGFGLACGDGICPGDPMSCWLAPDGCQADCGACPIGGSCAQDGDCASGFCDAGVCAATVPNGSPKPGDGVCDPTEVCWSGAPNSDPDSCGPCDSLSYCKTDNDCLVGHTCEIAGNCGAWIAENCRALQAFVWVAGERNRGRERRWKAESGVCHFGRGGRPGNGDMLAGCPTLRSLSTTPS